ncbi:MAG: flagellar type III secretion system pore protein FliP [Hyphomonadaceae bacterium]|nr:MAG: flagellar biosynthetic protein FliP [Caulobacteraceae bacterium]MBT9445313.1 flagellar type III secretion system pore protein FliP [Hyphomonadaceae bacterium]TPW05198.1 MAG: flagellar biosynthetic protein FliP [Alphaproteobacteria bacterium]
MRRVGAVIAIAATLALCAGPAGAEAAAREPGVSQVVRTGVLLSTLAFIPAIMICMTCFVRIVIVLGMVRHAFGMPETPPNAVLVSLALLLTSFVMQPTFSEVNRRAIQPLMSGSISVEHAWNEGAGPFKKFMLRQVRDADIAAVYKLSKTPPPKARNDVDLFKLATAYILNELRVAFTIGFVILLPFLLVDIVAASILLALGMMMVPPATISLPVKLLMFVMIDGWALIVTGVVGGIR